MEYTVQQLAKLSGVSKRTLHYYDEIDLLKPKAIRSNGYRIYAQRKLPVFNKYYSLNRLDLA